MSSREKEMSYQDFVKSVADKMVEFSNKNEVDYALLDCQMSMILKDIREKYEGKWWVFYWVCDYQRKYIFGLFRIIGCYTLESVF